MKQPDTQRKGPAQKLTRTPQGINRRGEGDNSKRGRGAPHSSAKEPQQGSPTTPQVAHTGQREDNRKNAGRNTNKKEHNTEEPQHERNRREQKKNRGQGKHPKNGNSGVQEGDRTTKRRAKRPPPRDSKWEQVTKRCQGTDGTEDRTGVNKTRQIKGRGEKGGSLRHTPCSIFKVMLFICWESVSPAVPDCKGDRIQPLLLCGMEPQFITFGLKGFPVSLLRFPT